MPRSWIYLLAVAAAAPVPAAAQTASGTSEQDRAIAEKMLGTGRITPDRIRNNCANPTRQGEIVVCGKNPEENRVPSTADADPTSKQALDDGRLHTPDVAGNGIFKGKPTFSFGSVEAPYIIDLDSIPVAPAGSDADKIAKGEVRAP